ncbi:hypothetical protein [Gracilinema caldarium]|uniref:Uncharacterized protein n=1 Tax=Gracilinema caldarium (strain ATCC 51460 / DSM 7334 / H1) TaxID=744872 RepID=F8F2E2_GRAC1|nr:hypothetical protein [Gracilinema caldarium]AEJ20924.1 hypothetical protein Spica_2830 [Gracilinema caldarium DSM 7334]
MAKRPKAIYEPGELEQTRQRLGDLDPEEARAIAEKLGGEIGIEKSPEPPKQTRNNFNRSETVNVSVKGGLRSSVPKHRVEVLETKEPNPLTIKRTSRIDKGDDPDQPFKTNYRERIKMDKLAAQVEFEIKTPMQVLISRLSLFSDPPDMLNPDFVTHRMNEYYSRFESLVTSTRSLLPRQNIRRTEHFKKVYPEAFAIIDTIRFWNIDLINTELSRLQAHPRNVKTSDFSDILKAIYKPILLLEHLDIENDIKEAYKRLYSILVEEDPVEAKEKYQGYIKSAIVAYSIIIKSIRYLLFPLLMKLVSDTCYSYESLFKARRKRIFSFLNISEKDRLQPVPPRETQHKEQPAANESHNKEEPTEAKHKEPDKEPEPISKGVLRGLETLESLFPGLPWQKLSSYPDLYPYFSKLFYLKKEYELIAPTDPLQQVAILMHILEELYYGLRYVSFSAIQVTDQEVEPVDIIINRIISNWPQYQEQILEKEYLHRLNEYCQILENSSESRTGSYPKRILMDLHWIKRLFFLPYYKFDSFSAPTIHKLDIPSFYSEVHTLKRLLTTVAASIDKAKKAGGPETGVNCDGIDNPWDPYLFQVPNPLSVRIDALLGGKNSKQRTNAALVYFTLAVTTVLDYIINNQSSWAYTNDAGIIFRSVDGEGAIPLYGTQTDIDPDLLFKEALKNRKS